MAGSDDLILHHFEDSPFSEKVRLALGMKGLAWRSVLIPAVMPKPDLVPLTGGYRRTPVMQAGADVFCDTQVILAEIERRHPSPSLLPAALPGLAWAVNWWADRLFFNPAMVVVFGGVGEGMDNAFVRDRERMSDGRFNLAAMQRAAGPMKGQYRAQAAWIEAQLAGGDWLAGAAPSLLDTAAYMNVWFLEHNLPQVAAELLAGLPRTQAWRTRVAGIGHGRRTELEPAGALDIARDSEPAGGIAHDDEDPLGAAPGDAVFVMADDYGRDRVTGVLVAANPERIVIERQDERVGRVHVHFPRAGYVAVKA